LASAQPKLSRAKQPLFHVLKDQRRGVAPTARAIGVSYLHFRQVVDGRTRPSREVRERLPELLGVPLSALFDAGSLRPPRGSAECDCQQCGFRRFRAAEQAVQR
jgi:hypothetical protein